jgi:hypothetical protein
VPAWSILASAAAAISAYFLGGVMGDLIVEDVQTGGTPRHARIVSGSRALSMTGLGTTCAIHVKVY